MKFLRVSFPRKVHRKLLGLAILFVLLAIAAALVFKTEQGNRVRVPASVILDDQGNELYADDSIDDLESRGYKERNQGALIGPRIIQTIPGFQDEFGLARLEVEKQTGISTRRGRVVLVRIPSLVEAAKSRQMKLELFSNLILQVRLYEPSAFSINHNVYTGQVEGDPRSKVHIAVTGNSVRGTIDADGRSYRIIDAGVKNRQRRHYVIEVDSRRP